MKRGKKGAKKAPAAKAIEGVVCPVCGKGVQESPKAFGCTAWREGCRFTLWKNCLDRAGGPQLNQKIVQLLLQSGEVKGSTGVIKIDSGYLTYTKTGEENPAARVSLIYEKAAK